MTVYLLAQHLVNEIKRMNMNLPARVWIPFCSLPHHVVRFAYTEATVLNSRDRVGHLQPYKQAISSFVH